jgi:hypothetical protein
VPTDWRDLQTLKAAFVEEPADDRRSGTAVSSRSVPDTEPQLEQAAALHSSRIAIDMRPMNKVMTVTVTIVMK